MNDFEAYVIEYRIRNNIMRFLCLDERRRGIKRLPRVRRGKYAENKDVIAKTCREIIEMKEKGMTWGEIADVYGTSRGGLRSFYMKYCR